MKVTDCYAMRRADERSLKLSLSNLELIVNLDVDQQTEAITAVPRIYLSVCFGQLSVYLQAFLCKDWL